MPVFVEGMIGITCLLAHVGCLTCDASRYTGSASSFIGLCWSFNGKTGTSKGSAVSMTVPESTNTYFENCRFYDMATKSQNGGAVYINGKGTHEFHFCEFKNVQGGGSGGAICVENIWNVVVDTCIFDKVQAPQGGAFYVVLTTGGQFIHINDSEFLDCISVKDSMFDTMYDGAVGYCSGPIGSAMEGSLAKCTFDNCSISYSQETEATFISSIYLELTTTEMPVTFQNCVFNSPGITYTEHFLSLLSCEKLLLKNNTFNQVKITGTNPLLKPDKACKSLEVLDCDFQTVTSACDGSVVDSQGITSVTLDNCSFGSCSATATTSGGVVVVSAGTGECQVIDCKFVANSCDKGVHSLRIISTSFVNLTRCTFSGHTGSLPVLLADGGSALQSTNDFLINDCVFNDNSLSSKDTGVIVFPTDKSVQFDRCTFTNNQASVTLTKCSKMSFDFCFFTVSLDDAPVPVIRDNGTPELQIRGCSFAHTGTEPEGGSTYQYVVIENEKCNAVISQNCFSSDDKNAIQLPSGANVGNGNEFGAECQEPWNPPEQPGSSGNTDPEVPPPASSDPILNDEFPYGPVIGGVIGGIAVIAVLAILIFFFVVRRKRQPTQTESDNNSEYLAHSDGVAA